MNKNMGTTDKAIRIIVAIIISALYFSNVISGTIAIVLIILAAIFTLTSIIGVCPLYLPFGINTCAKKQ